MPSREPSAIKGQRIYEDEALVLLCTKGPFGISYPMFMSFYVYLKQREILVKVSSQEKRFLLAVMGEWKQLGLSPQQLESTDLFEDFSDAVAVRGGARWSVFFGQGTPRELAIQYRSYI